MSILFSLCKWLEKVFKSVDFYIILIFMNDMTMLVNMSIENEIQAFL